jgi:membrane-bound lytic murein transglycosylase B
LTVAQLSNRLQGLPALTVQETQNAAISISDTSQLQELLLQAGFDPGEPDGIAGPQTHSAIREYQKKHGLIADGYPSQALLDHIMENVIQEQRD